MSAQVFPPGSDDAAFERAVALVKQHEGGLTDSAGDPGGLTNYGLSQRQYPALDLSKITWDQAKALYRRDYWDRFGLGLLPPTLACHVMDFAVSAGPEEAIKTMQRGLRACGQRILDDGVIGIQTRTAVAAADERILIAAFQGLREGFYRMLAKERPAESFALHSWLDRTYAAVPPFVAVASSPAAPAPAAPAESQAHG